MKRVLIITYYWPPSGGSGVQRWLKFAKYLPSFGWQPVIYTPSNPQSPATDMSLEKEVPAEAIVIKRAISEPYTFYKRFFSGKSDNKGGGTVVNPINQSGKKSLLQKISLWVRANMFIPDPKRSWIAPSVKYLLGYLEENRVDAIVSTGPPHSMHLIAKELHRKTGIRWVADFRDPWTRIFYFKHLPTTSWAKKRHEKLELAVVSEADAVVSVTNQMTQEFATLLNSGVENSRLYTVCNGYDEDDFVSVEVNPDRHFTLLHTGLFSADGNPVRLWKVLAGISSENKDFAEDLRIRLVGKVDREVISSIVESGLSHNLENLGYLPHSDIPGLQKGCWGLLLPLRDEPESKGILTGKFFEYLASERPIVAFGPEDGEVAKVLGETSSGVIFDWNEEEKLKSHVIRLYEDYRSSNWIRNIDKGAISKYSRRELTGEMVEILEKTDKAI